MTRSGIWTTLNLARVTIGSSMLMLWGGFLIWWGWDLLFMPGFESGGFSFVAGGSLMIVLGGVPLLYHLMKARVPVKHVEKPGEAAERAFDADAALDRYLARKGAEPVSPLPVQAAVSAPARPAFGRRVAPPQP